jgi:GNAT superfamily N-acetyltransferase
MNLNFAKSEPSNPGRHSPEVFAPQLCKGMRHGSSRREPSRGIRHMPDIMPLHPEDAARWLPQLIGLLQDAVDSGASVGFLAPLSDDQAQQYWTQVFAQVGERTRIVLAAVHNGAIVGSVQLDLASMPNASHRAEVQKLLVLRLWRRQGTGQELMTAIEQAARREGRQLLVLDTRLGDAAERLYARMGYRRVGVIPKFALNSAGSLDATVIFYRDLST